MSRPIKFPSEWRTVAVAAGGVSSLSRLLGVNERTLRRWAHGQSPVSALATVALTSVCKKLKTSVPTSGFTVDWVANPSAPGSVERLIVTRHL